MKMEIYTPKRGFIAQLGDLILFEYGRGYILGFFERNVDPKSILVSWGDCQRVVDIGSYLVGKREFLKPEIGKYIGHHFESFEEVRSLLGSCGTVPMNEIEVT